MIFDKNNNGAEEFKSLLGFIYAANKFANLKSYLPFAKREVVSVIGNEIYKVAEDHYNSDNYNSSADEFKSLNELVNYVQLPIALHAYRRFVVSNDLTHSDAGRQITVTETEKPAFEWQIDKDNKNLLQLANEAMDVLLEFLDEQLTATEGSPSDIGNAWMESAAFSVIKSSIVNSPIDVEGVVSFGKSRRSFMQLAPFFKKAERSMIPGAITTLRYEALIEAIKDGDLSADQKKLRELCIPVIVNYGLAKALKVLPGEVLTGFLGEHFSSDNNREADSDARLGAAQVFEQEGKRDYSALQRYIKSITPLIEEEEEIDEDPTLNKFFLA